MRNLFINRYSGKYGGNSECRQNEVDLSTEAANKSLIDQAEYAFGPIDLCFANAGVVAPGYVTPWAAPGMPGKVLAHLLAAHEGAEAFVDGRRFGSGRAEGERGETHRWGNEGGEGSAAQAEDHGATASGRRRTRWGQAGNGQRG